MEDRSGSILFKKAKVDQALVASRSRDIYYENTLVGRVHIALASGYYTVMKGCKNLVSQIGIAIFMLTKIKLLYIKL